MKYKTDLDKILGPDIIPKFFEFIKKGTIRKSNLKNMADEMGVRDTFDTNEDKGSFDQRTTLYEMLDMVLC